MNAQRMLIGILILGLLLTLAASPVPLSGRASAPTRLTADQVIAAAVNDLEATADGYRLRHPRYVATFTPAGLQFTPRRGGPAWAWQLTAVRVGDTPLAGVTIGAVRPVREQPATVAYPRGRLVEQYLTQKGSLEQQFVIPQSLPLAGADLVIQGAVQCTGAFEETSEGWLWRTAGSGVRLGHARVYDARGAALPATMAVTAEATRIVVDGAALARAAYPVTVDPEIGANDFRLSDMGPDGNASYDAFFPAVAYNSINNEYLVVWHGDDNAGLLVDEEYEIYGQRVDAATGAEIGGDLRLSDMGPDGNASYDARYPAIAYNSAHNEYLVVWHGDDNTGLLVDDEWEIYGQRVDGATGAEIGGDVRLSDMGSDGNASYGAYYPAVAYNSVGNEYLVVWMGDDNSGALVNDEYEIYGQRVNAATGAEIGANDFCLSDMGPDGDANYDAYSPAVAYSSRDNQYLVVWYGDDNAGGLVDNEFEIYGQRVNAATGAEIGGDVRLSDMGPDGDVNYEVGNLAVTCNSANHEYLVVWSGDDNTDGLVNDEFEIYGQRVNAVTGAEIGPNDFRLSDMGPDGNTSYNAFFPAVAYDPANNEYLVVWASDDNTAPLVDNELEIFGQRVDGATGAKIGGDFRLSDMGPEGNASYGAWAPAVAYNSANHEYLGVWSGDDNTASLVDEEYEIFGQRFARVCWLYLPLVMRQYP